MLQRILGNSNYEVWPLNSELTLKNYCINKIVSYIRFYLQSNSHRKLNPAPYEPFSCRKIPRTIFWQRFKQLCNLIQTSRVIDWKFRRGFLWHHKINLRYNLNKEFNSKFFLESLYVRLCLWLFDVHRSAHRDIFLQQNQLDAPVFLIFVVPCIMLYSSK